MTPEQLDQPVTAAQIADAALVLGKVKAHDPGASNPDPAVAVAWAEAFAVHKLERRDLLAGVRALFADDTRPHDRVLAQDVIRKARAIRRDRAERESPVEIAARDDARDRQVLARAAERGRELRLVSDGGVVGEVRRKFVRPSERRES